MERQRLALSLVALHLLLTVLHGVVHAAVPLYPVGWKAMVAAVVLYLLPVLGAGLVVNGYRRVGAVFLVSAGLAGFVFEGVFHFVLVNPDHVSHVTNQRMAFDLTAALTTGGDLLLVGAAWFGVPVTGRLGKYASSTIE